MKETMCGCLRESLYLRFWLESCLETRYLFGPDETDPPGKLDVTFLYWSAANRSEAWQIEKTFSLMPRADLHGRVCDIDLILGREVIVVPPFVHKCLNIDTVAFLAEWFLFLHFNSFLLSYEERLRPKRKKHASFNFNVLNVFKRRKR